mmetsp:Transcript_600/g.2169  ORF Transcript_600/g.2169 Transcript_600/m.2169 type:complete len:113 (-) Transcript_600:943-1281(-)
MSSNHPPKLGKVGGPFRERGLVEWKEPSEENARAAKDNPLSLISAPHLLVGGSLLPFADDAVREFLRYDVGQILDDIMRKTKDRVCTTAGLNFALRYHAQKPSAAFTASMGC